MERTHKKVENKIASFIGIFAKLRYKLSKEICFKLYDTLVLPHLNYCNIIWASTYKTVLRRLHSLQKRFLKICHLTYINKIEDYQLFQLYNKLSIYHINTLQLCKFIYSTIHGITPLCFQNYFSSITLIHNHNTRQTNTLFIHPSRTNIRKMFITNLGPIIWNTIPEKIKVSRTLCAFAKSLKTHLLSIL